MANELVDASDGTTVRFRVGNGHVDIDVRDGRLWLTADGMIAVLPRAANQVWVQFVGERK